MPPPRERLNLTDGVVPRRAGQIYPSHAARFDGRGNQPRQVRKKHGHLNIIFKLGEPGARLDSQPPENLLNVQPEVKSHRRSGKVIGGVG